MGNGSSGAAPARSPAPSPLPPTNAHTASRLDANQDAIDRGNAALLTDQVRRGMRGLQDPKIRKSDHNVASQVVFSSLNM